MSTQLQMFNEQSASKFRRRTDPETSQQSARGIAPKVGTVKAKVLEFAKGMTEPFTACEIAESLYSVDKSKRAETYRKRVRELQRAGLLKESGERECKITGSNATTFEVA